MALPVFTGWTIAHWVGGNRAGYVTDNADQLVAMKNAMVAAGWTVRRSSTGTTMADSDLWTDYTSIGQTCWTILQKNGKEICFFRNNADGIMYPYYSASGVFVSSTATAVPAAADRIDLPTFQHGANGGGAASARRIDYWYKGDQFRMIGHHNTPYVNNNSLFYIDVVSSPRAELTDNFLVGSGTCNLADCTNGTQMPYGWMGGVTIRGRMSALGNASGWLVEQVPYSATLPDGEWGIMASKYWHCPTASKHGILGEVSDWYFCHPNVTIGTTMPSTGEKTHIVYNNVVLPWDGTASWSA